MKSPYAVKGFCQIGAWINADVKAQFTIKAQVAHCN